MSKVRILSTAVLVVASIVALTGCGDLGNVVSDQIGEMAPGVNNSIPLTMEKYNQLKVGMSPDQVKAIMGGEGELNTESDLAGTTGLTWAYNNLDENYKIKAVYVSFINGVLFSKSETGL